MSRLVLSLVVATAVSGLWSTQAMAQRDAGAKARGDYGRGFWNTTNNSSVSSGAVYYRQPMAASANSQQYRSFSYEPTTIHKGDSVVVDRENVNMMLGSKSLGTLPKDTKFDVIKVTNGWLGAEVEVNGQKMKGWIWNQNVRAGQTLDEVAPAPPAADNKG